MPWPNIQPWYETTQEVVYVGMSDFQVNWGGCADPRGVLVEGETYITEAVAAHSYHTKVRLEGIDGAFPSGAFSGLGVPSGAYELWQRWRGLG